MAIIKIKLNPKQNKKRSAFGLQEAPRGQKSEKNIRSTV